MSTSGDVDNKVDMGVRILSLDGGGPGTYSQLLIIKEYMVRLASDLGKDEADVYPADYFDLMGGVGFGGLVAILLGHLWMNVDEAIDSLLAVALTIFPGNPHHTSDPEANTKQLRDSVKAILHTRGIPPDRGMQGKDEQSRGCKVALYTAAIPNLSHPIVLRNYKHRGSSLNSTIVDAVCATMATPSCFCPVKIGARGREQTFMGGPVGAYNPTRELLKEAGIIFGKEKLVAQIVSLGCGRSHASSTNMHTDTEGVSWVVREMKVDCETVEKELSTRLCDMDAYLRLNVDRGMENLLMSDWDDLGAIGTLTSAYTEGVIISDAIEASLKGLQGSTGTVTLGQINHPSTAKEVRDRLEMQREDLELVINSVRDSAEDSQILERLKPVDTPSYYEDHICMEGTRAEILDEILAWVATSVDRKTQPKDSTSNVFWLYGMPGLGKTSVANSLCDHLRKNGSLGGSFFCKHDNPDLREPKRVLPTLIAKLMRMWAPFRKLVAKTLLDEPQINPQSTRGELLLRALETLKEHSPRPLVLVIDALDECGQPSERGSLLNSLREACSLVDWLKVVITSRPERDIKSFFDGHRIIGRDLAIDDLEGKDIRLFTERRMASVANGRHLSPDWPGTERVTQIVERARGLFVFVDTLSRLVDGLTPEPLLVEVLSGKLEDANAELHKLYSAVIRSRAARHTREFHRLLRAVVAVSAFRPLCAETLAHLLAIEVSTVLSWLDELGSLFYRDGAKNDGVRVRHLSVLEFLVGCSCPPEYRVDQRLANSEIAHHCLKTMSNKLQFNICGLETSSLLNRDIVGLDARVEQRIPDSLQYSCMHWSNHICYDVEPISAELKGLLDDFFTGPQTLYWIEVLSLMGRAPVAISALRLMKAHFKKFEDRHQRLVEDALRLLLAFFSPISTSTPHTYISALPFMPMESELWKRASISFPNIIDVSKGRTECWPAPPIAWLGHAGIILSVAYAPDGQNVVSGSSDSTIRIWDAQTGAVVGQPLQGHTGYVWSVAYSPDGRNIISGSDDNTIRIWDAQTGAAVGQPLQGYTGYVWSVAYSPDGRNIISGSDDSTIRIWDAQTGAAVGQPLQGHTDYVRSVAYSPDGRNIISGSSDSTIRIWDAQTGAAVGQPLQGHTGSVVSVAYSPDGRNIISGSDDKTIRIWDAQTGAAVGQPLQGHTGYVSSVAYSPDGRNIISGSSDSTIRIWDAQTGAAVGQPLQGHTGPVWSVAYSPDGRNIISGSDDNTIRIWDAQTGAAVGQPLQGYTGYVWSVAYSPDGRNIISGSDDKTIRIWDAQTGAAVGQPLHGHTGRVWSVAYSPDGRNIISGSDDKTIRIWDAQTGAAVGQPLQGHTGSVVSFSYSPDGRNIISGSDDKTIRIWDAQTGAAVGQPLHGHTGRVWSVAYSPDGRNIISASGESTIRIWDAQTGAAVGQPLQGHTGYVSSVAYSPDGRNIISGSSDSTIRIWDAQTGAAVGQPLQGHTDYVRSVAYSPDGRNIISGSSDSTIRIWDAQTGAAVGQPLQGHTGYVSSVAYSPDGRNIISVSDSTIRIWDAQTGAAVGQPLQGHTGSVVSVTYSPDGWDVSSGSGDNSIRTWDVHSTAIENDVVSHSSHPPNNWLPLTAFSGRPIPKHWLGQDGWVRGEEGLLFWVPEDSRHGLTCPAMVTIPNTGLQRCVRIDFSRFQYGASWTHIRG